VDSFEILKWSGIGLQIIGYVIGLVAIFKEKRKSITNIALIVTFSAFVITTFAGFGLGFESAQKIADANRHASEANEKAKAAVLSAGKLGVSQEKLKEFVRENIIKNELALSEIKKSTSGLNSARADARLAADQSRNDLRTLQTMLARQRDLTKQIERVLPHVYRISWGITYNVPSENCTINVVNGNHSGQTKIYLPRKPFQGQIVTVQNMRNDLGGGTIEIFGNGYKIAQSVSVLIINQNDGGGAGSLTMTFDVDQWSAAGIP
jgi:nitrogen fixation protein